MSTPGAFAVAAVVAVVSLAVAFWRTCRALRAASERVRAALASPASDAEPGGDLAARDACELAWAMDAYTDPAMEAGLERLWDAIRDEHSKGDQ